MLKTVAVPEEMTSVFEKAEQAVSTYFLSQRADPSQGTIEIFGERYVLIRAASLSIEFFTMVRNLFGEGREDESQEFARNILYDLAHAIGKSDANNFQEKMNLSDPLERLSAGPIHFAHAGWAFVDISSESRPAPDDTYYLLYDHPYSFESSAWLQQGATATYPVCIMNAGYSSGWCEESFGIHLVSTEILCRAQGHDCCRFIMAPPKCIEGHVERYRREQPHLAEHVGAYQIPDFFSRKRMEEALRTSETRYRGIFEASADALLVCQPNGLIEDVNPSACRLFERAPHQLKGTPWDALLTKQHPDFASKLWKKDASQPSPVVEVSWSGRHLALRKTSFSDAPNEQILITIRDVTTRKEAELAIRLAKEKAEASDAAKSLFLANMSHEVRTPLNGLIGMLQLFNDSELADEQRENVRVMNRSARTLLTIIEDILDFSKIDAGKVELAPEKFHLLKALKEIVASYRVPAISQGLEFDLELAPSLPTHVIGDSSRMGQILNNLLSNALKFTEKGRVLLRVGEKTPGSSTGHLVFEVIDTGIGIGEDKQTAIFDAFAQADSSISRHHAGLGLGLTISRRLAQIMGGDLTMTSERGLGSRFILSLPLPPTRESDVVALKHAQPDVIEKLYVHRQPPRILLAEDNEINRLVMSRLLERHGCQVTVVENGSIAIPLALSEAFDLIMLDCAMPVMDGFATATELCRVMDAGVRPPIVAVTAGVMRQDQEKCLAAGMDDFVPKPVMLDDLVRVLKRWVPDSQDPTSKG